MSDTIRDAHDLAIEIVANRTVWQINRIADAIERLIEERVKAGTPEIVSMPGEAPAVAVYPPRCPPCGSADDITCEECIATRRRWAQRVEANRVSA